MNAILDSQSRSEDKTIRSVYEPSQYFLQKVELAGTKRSIGAMYSCQWARVAAVY